MTQMPPLRLIWLLLVALPIAICLALSTGVVDTPFLTILSSLGFHLGLPVAAAEPQQELILWSLRVPRVLLAALVGASLAVCGAAMQGLFRNPLADPTLIGVSSGAAVGAGFAIVVGATVLLPVQTFFDGILGELAPLIKVYSISLCAFAGGFVTTLLVYKIGRGANGLSVSTMLLAGIAINALAAAITNLFRLFADDIELRRLSLWRMGGLEGANGESVLIAASLLGLVLLVLPRYSQVLNALLLGESEARHLGVDVERLKKGLITWTALGVGVAVSLAGIIGFVGLVVPHLVRLLIGPDHRYLMPASALLGATLLVLADCLARYIAAPAEIPIGIVTAILGAPFFISLLLQQRRRLI